MREGKAGISWPGSWQAGREREGVGGRKEGKRRGEREAERGSLLDVQSCGDVITEGLPANRTPPPPRVDLQFCTPTFTRWIQST